MDRRIIIGGAGLLIALIVIINLPKGNKETISVASQKTITANELYKNARELRAANELLEAKFIYEEILEDFPDFEEVQKIQDELEQVNMDVIFSRLQTPDTIIHEVQSGDTLGKLAKKYGTTVDLIKRGNNLKSNVIRIGQKLRVWTSDFNILVDKSQNILILKKNDEVVKVYKVSTGENNSTPIGTFKIVNKLIDPVWFNRGAVVPPESPHNVLGSRWLGFDIPGYGIHGTVDPDAIGQQVTAGCVRMRNEDVEELYSMITIGTETIVVD